MKTAFTIQAKAVDKIVRRAAAHGVKADDLYRAVNLDPSVLLDSGNRIPFAQVVDLYEKAARLTGDNDFGLHVGQTVDVKVFDVVGYSALNELLEQMRRQLAMQYLREREMAICEVAYLLGFSESSSFHRASNAGRA